MAGSKRCIFLAGAPDIEDLDWDDHGLRTTFSVPVKRFLQDEDVTGEILTQATPPPTYTKWRHVTLKNELATNPNSDTDVEQTQFLSFDNSNLGSSQADFLDSIAQLEDMSPLNIVPQASIPNDEGNGTRFKTSFLSDSSLTTTSFGTTDASFALPQIENAGIDTPITDLKRIPNADYITRIQPQTMTINLIVGIISVSAIRTVRLRRRNGVMDIVDLAVGDETRAGFGISFWLAPVDSQHKPIDDLRKTISALRPGDVVLLRNVALTCWNGCVFGQSLGRRFAKNSTSIAVTADDECNTKVRRVKQWTSDFVGVASGAKTTKTKADETARVLPPDTQDDSQD